VTVFLQLQACTTGLVIKNPVTLATITALNYQKSELTFVDAGFTVQDGSATDCGPRTLTAVYKSDGLAKSHVKIAVDLVDSSKYTITVLPVTEAFPAQYNYVVRIVSDVYSTVTSDFDFIIDVTGDCPIT